jgi:hypothetical protein
MKRITQRQRALLDKHQSIISLYTSCLYTTETIARNYGLTVRQVQRIAKKAGVIRTISESNKLMAKFKNYQTIPIEHRVRRKQITKKKRYLIIQAHPYCTNCGMKPLDGVRLEVDHIDNDATNNNDNNLQVLCTKCNQGKSNFDRFGV